MKTRTLLEAREATGLSRERFAEIIGMAPQQLRCYEVGSKRAEARNARRIANALGTDLEDIREFEHIVGRERAEREVRERMAASGKPVQ